MKTNMLDKVGTYEFLAEPFHCDFTKKLFIGHLGNHLLNAADFHATERGFGMDSLNLDNKTWVLSRLAIEMTERPKEYARFNVETWIEGAMKYFTHRNFRIVDSTDSSRVYGYGRSIWAMIDTITRQPQDILAVNNGSIINYIDTEKPCPIAQLSRVKMSNNAKLVSSINTSYSDVDVNGHINSIKYIEHVLGLFALEWHSSHVIRRFDIAYVAESHYGDQLEFYREDISENVICIRIMKIQGDNNPIEVCRCKITTE